MLNQIFVIKKLNKLKYKKNTIQKYTKAKFIPKKQNCKLIRP